MDKTDGSCQTRWLLFVAASALAISELDELRLENQKLHQMLQGRKRPPRKGKRDTAYVLVRDGPVVSVPPAATYPLVAGGAYNTTSAYESEPTKINVHIISHSHEDPGWNVNVDQSYVFSDQGFQPTGVKYILDSLIPLH